MKIESLKEKHPAIYDLAIQRWEEQKDWYTGTNENIMNFTWSKTAEGDTFWHLVWSGEFEKAYNLGFVHPSDFSIEEQNSSDYKIITNGLFKVN